MNPAKSNAGRATRRGEKACVRDMGCGCLEPIVRSDLMTVLRYKREADHPNLALDHAYPTHAIVLTTHGEWLYHGAKRSLAIDEGSVVAGMSCGEYACKHAPGLRNDCIILALQDGALNGDDSRLFVRDVLPSTPEIRAHQRAIVTATDAARVESLVFSLFDLIGEMSTGGGLKRGYDVRMEYATRLIDENCSSPLKVRDIAREMGLSPFTLARRFRTHTGSRSWLRNARPHRARKAPASHARGVDRANSGC